MQGMGHTSPPSSLVRSFYFIVWPSSYVSGFSLVRPRGGQADQLLDKVINDELDRHNHAHVQQTGALRREGVVRGKEGDWKGNEICSG